MPIAKVVSGAESIDLIRKATLALVSWCQKYGFLFEQPSATSALYEFDGKKYVRLEKPRPGLGGFADVFAFIYQVESDGSLSELPVPSAELEAAWGKTNPWFLVSRN